LDISNEIAEALNNIKREEAALSIFIQSLKSYSSGLKNLEYNTQRGLNEIQTVDKMVVMTGREKAIQVGAKTITNDIIGGGLTAVSGGELLYASIVVEPETGGVSTVGVIVGGSMVASGVNTMSNGVRNLKYEWNYEWAEVGQHNFLSDYISNIATYATRNDKTGKIAGNAVTTFVDSVSTGKSLWDLRTLPKDVTNIAKGIKTDDILGTVKSADTILRSDALGTYYNYVTIKGDINALQDSVYGDSSKNNNVMDGVNINSNKVISTYPNIVTIYNDGKPKLWLKDIDKTTK